MVPLSTYQRSAELSCRPDVDGVPWQATDVAEAKAVVGGAEIVTTGAVFAAIARCHRSCGAAAESRIAADDRVMPEPR